MRWMDGRVDGMGWDGMGGLSKVNEMDGWTIE